MNACDTSDRGFESTYQPWPGQRAQFTWALNQYNLAEDPETRPKFAKRMAKYIVAAPADGFTVDEVTQGQMLGDLRIEELKAQRFEAPSSSAPISREYPTSTARIAASRRVAVILPVGNARGTE
jgi:hypothetical protein